MTVTLYGGFFTVVCHVPMAGEAKDDPVPLIGAGVVAFAFSSAGERVDWEFLVTFVPAGTVVVVDVDDVVVVPPIAPVVVVTVGDVVEVVAPSAPAGTEVTATVSTETIPTPIAPRSRFETLASPRGPMMW